MISPERMIEIVREKVLAQIRKETVRVRYATIDPNYTTGLPRVTFDGETTLTLKGYAHLAHYTPAAGDRVQIVNRVIQGRIVS